MIVLLFVLIFSSSAKMEGMSLTEKRVYECLKQSGLHLKSAWIKQAMAERAVASKAEDALFQLALYSDFRSIGSGCLPNDIGSSSDVCKIEGRYVLQVNYSDFSVYAERVYDLGFGQVEELVNISESVDSRRAENRCRTLKLLLTDGLQSVTGLEVRCIKDLNVNSPAGMKVLCENFEIRRGIALFGPDSLKVVGGMVAVLERSRLERIEQLESAKKRRQLVPVFPPAPPDGEQSQQLPPGQSGQSADNAQIISHEGNLSHLLSEHRQPSLLGGVTLQPSDLESRVLNCAEMPRSTQNSERLEGQGVAPVQNAMSITRAIAGPEPDVTTMIDIDFDENLPEVSPRLVVSSPQQPLPHAERAERAAVSRQALCYLRRLLMLSGEAAAARSSVGTWVQAAVMGVGRFDCNVATGYSLQLLLVDGTARVWAWAGDAVVEGLIGITSAEYAQCDKRQMKPQRARLSSLLSRLAGRFQLAPRVNPSGTYGGDPAGGEVQFEVRQIDPDSCTSIAWALVERVDRALATLGPTW